MVNMEPIVSDLSLSRNILFVFPQATLTDDVTELSSILELHDTRQRVAVIVPFITEDTSLSQSFSLIERMRKVYAYDVLLLEQKHLQSLIISKSPRATFRRLLLSQVDLVMTSPFVIIGPTRPDFSIPDFGFKWLGIPEIQWFHRLDIVVTVYQDGGQIRSYCPGSKNDRLTLGFHDPCLISPSFE